MVDDLEHGLLLVARITVGSVLLLLVSLIAYGVGGFLFFAETIELTYPFLDVNRDPVLNFFLVLKEIGMFITSLPILLLATFFSQNGIDVM